MGTRLKSDQDKSRRRGCPLLMLTFLAGVLFFARRRFQRN